MPPLKNGSTDLKEGGLDTDKSPYILLMTTSEYDPIVVFIFSGS